MKNACELGLSRHPPQRDKRVMTENFVRRSSQSEMNDQYREEELRKINELQREYFNRHVDLRDLVLPGNKLDAIFINGCFSNIVDKEKVVI